MTRARLAGEGSTIVRRFFAAGFAASLAALFFGDLAIPGPAGAPPQARPAAPLARVLPELPARNAGRFGKPGDPLNLVFVGGESRVRSTLAEAGWTPIPLGISASFRAGLGELLRGRMFRSCPPMNVYTLDGRPQDMNWSKPLTPIARRHHFRLWRSGWRDERGRDVWWGSGNLDLKVRWRDLSHVPDPDMDAEREAVMRSLDGSPAIESIRLESAPQVPREGANDKGYPFRTDGRVLVVRLKD